jgi:hypothetical protein
MECNITLLKKLINMNKFELWVVNISILYIFFLFLQKNKNKKEEEEVVYISM